MLRDGDVAPPEENAMGWEVRFWPSSGRGSPSPSVVGSRADALTHARVLLDRDRGGAVEVREEGSETIVVYRMANGEMVALGEAARIGDRPD